MLKMLKHRVIVFFAIALLALSYTSVAGEEGTDTEKSPEAPVQESAPQEKMTREEMLEYLDTMFTHRLDIREKIPGLLEVEGPDGKYFEYNGLPLEKMSDDAVFGLVRYVNQQVSQKNLENLQRTQRQLRQLKQIQQINRNQKMMRDLRKHKTYRQQKY